MLAAPMPMRFTAPMSVESAMGSMPRPDATGLMLLRTVDPENRTSAAMSFGYKQLLHEPFMGGGIWTALAFTLVYQIGWMKVWLISVGMLVLWGVASFLVARSRRQ